ncbi:MAG: hydroxyisourate hydrolase [Bacteriovorax sp.]|jgi:5-hydroxyisourate hydrolase
MISTHILDTSKGQPAAHVAIMLEKKEANGQWKPIGSGVTNTDGRLAFECEKITGVYRLNFEIEAYFKKAGVDFFFLDTSIVFQVLHLDRKYHVPLLLNPYGYTTYRGS